ncbi:hypothetical protein HD554DRAFT_2207051 [Boletus coccyginus]|nr:hypothetical protein HD554DRAFT_2207051 [Boletus coccyginus]
MISRCWAKSWIIQLQCGMHGHVIVFPQDPESVVDLLPPSIVHVINPICVIFEKVFAVLQWLREHNPFYKDVRVNYGALDSLDDDDILPVHVEVSLTARYGSVSRGEPSTTTDVDISESVVAANIDPNAPSHVLRAAAMEHITAKLGKAYVHIPHGARPVA